eukprot:COSAG06_NODE_34883_length_468_cov_0.642276_1_plen_86_part_10
MGISLRSVSSLLHRVCRVRTVDCIRGRSWPLAIRDYRSERNCRVRCYSPRSMPPVETFLFNYCEWKNLLNKRLPAGSVPVPETVTT